MKYKHTIEEVSDKLESGELTAEDFYCPVDDFDHLPNVKVHGNIVLSWSDVVIIHPVTGKHLNITKPKQEDYDADSLAELQHSFNQNGVDLDDWPPAVKHKPIVVGGYKKWLMEWGMNREAVLCPRSNKWVFTLMEIPPEDERDAKMRENEPKKRQRFNPDSRIIDNLYEDCLAKHKNIVDEITGDVCEKKLEEKVHRAYGKTRTKKERDRYLKAVIKKINKTEGVTLKVKPIIKYDTDAKQNAWNKREDGTKKYVLGGERNLKFEGMYDESVINQFGYFSKAGTLDRQYDRSLQKAFSRPIDEDGNDLEPNPRVSFVFVWVDGDTPEEIQTNRKKAVKEYDDINLRNQWAGSDTSFWYVKGFVNQCDEIDGNVDYIPIKEIRKHMK